MIPGDWISLHLWSSSLHIIIPIHPHHKHHHHNILAPTFAYATHTHNQQPLLLQNIKFFLTNTTTITIFCFRTPSLMKSPPPPSPSSLHKRRRAFQAKYFTSPTSPIAAIRFINQLDFYLYQAQGVESKVIEKLPAALHNDLQLAWSVPETPMENPIPPLPNYSQLYANFVNIFKGSINSKPQYLLAP